MMIGLPGSGKSTWIDNFLTEYRNPNIVVASSDHYIEEVAKREGKTYNEVFKDTIKDATQYVTAITDVAVQGGVDCIWDQTNLTRKARGPRLAKFRGYRKIGVFVQCDDVIEWHHRLASRPGKTIPINVLNLMITSIEPPTMQEDFDEILEVNTAA